MPYIKPTSDIFIKYLLGTEEHKDLLLSFINAVMDNSGFPLTTGQDYTHLNCIKEININAFFL